ncbi:MAG: menaquinone-dependent protoporphyrinogen IX dehydrogenase [Gammaproteobacteria bacterium]
MKSVLVLYMTRGGHTARIARRICASINAAGGQAEMMELTEAVHEGVDWEAYDVVALGAPVFYGTYNESVFEFIKTNQARLEAKPNSFFNVSVVARTPEKATVEGNRYMQKFLELSPWKPRDLKVIAGKVDYPSWGWLDTIAIQMIMKFTKGPTDKTAVIDYTNWDDVDAYGRHLLSLAEPEPKPKPQA